MRCGLVVAALGKWLPRRGPTCRCRALGSGHDDGLPSAARALRRCTWCCASCRCGSCCGTWLWRRGWRWSGEWWGGGAGGAGGSGAGICGNGVVEAGETCDGDCPESCAPAVDACSASVLRGSAGDCDATRVSRRRSWWRTTSTGVRTTRRFAVSRPMSSPAISSPRAIPSSIGRWGIFVWWRVPLPSMPPTVPMHPCSTRPASRAPSMATACLGRRRISAPTSTCRGRVCVSGRAR
jgi:hypothetical protein